MAARLRVLIVDDSLLYRKIVRDSLASIPDVEVVGSATNGKMAIEKIAELGPDLVTLDFEMPELDGLGVLKWLRQHRLPTKAVMLSAVTQEGAEATVKALQEGAFDFVQKPSSSDVNENREALVRELLERVRIVRFLTERKTPNVTQRSATTINSTPPTTRVTRREFSTIKAVGIGVSTGGPDALRVMLPQLPATLGVPVFLVQHMPPVFTKSLANSLDKLCKLRVQEAVDGELANANHIYIAPGGKQMKVLTCPQGTVIRLTDDAPVQSCRPSVDYLFDSLATTFGAKTLSVIMTGMGYDGAESCRKLYTLGGPVIAQDETSCVVFGMPRRPVEEGYADVVSPLDRIASHIERFVRLGGAA